MTVNEHGCRIDGDVCISHGKSEHCPTECSPGCGHYTERALAALRKGELPQIVATVKAGDSLVFLAPDMANWNPAVHQAFRKITALTLGDGIEFAFVPAVGVVHVPAPEMVVGCPHHHVSHGYCCEPKDHDGPHVSLSGTQWGPKSGD